jgi:hypothetical protein
MAGMLNMGALLAARPVAGQASAEIGCPIKVAFDYVGDGFFEHYRLWCAQVVELEVVSQGSIGVGTLARQVTLDRDIATESTFKIEEFSPPKVIALAGVSDPFRSVYALEEASAALTRLVFTFEMRELELFMRPFEKLVRTALQEGAQQIVDNLKQLLEEQGAIVASQS